MSSNALYGSALRAASARIVKPTPAQAIAGNYRKGHLRLHGLDITIETPKGGLRSGVGPDGKRWSVRLPAAYGYIKRSEGADGDQVDVYVGERPDAPFVWIVDQIDPDAGRFDEHKSFVGFATVGDVVDAYCDAFSDDSGTDRLGVVTRMTVGGFKDWLKSGDTKRAIGWKSRNALTA